MIFIPEPFPDLDWSSRVSFSVNGLDRRTDMRSDAAAVAAAFADPRRRLLLFSGDRLLVKTGERPGALIGDAEARELEPALGERVFLGLDAGGAPWFASAFRSDPELEADEALFDLRALAMAGLVGEEIFGPAAQARAMLFWHQRHRYCGNCGAPTVVTAAGYQRSCPACGAQHFPRTDPVVIMMITRGDRALLGRQARFAPGLFTCLAGFMEPGETVEDAVRREVFEESAIRVGAVRYQASQPWPFPANLMLGCVGEALSDDIVMDPHELEDCRWFSRTEVAAMLAGTHPDGLIGPISIAVARLLIETWVQNGG